MANIDGSKIGKLEIPAKQALTWLYERRMVPYDWAKLLTAVHVKYEELRASFPQDTNHNEAIKAIATMLQESPKPQYSTAKDVFQRLGASGTEFGEKSFFGSYKHPVTREWQLLVQIYEKQALYWAEQARFI